MATLPYNPLCISSQKVGSTPLHNVFPSLVVMCSIKHMDIWLLRLHHLEVVYNRLNRLFIILLHVYNSCICNCCVYFIFCLFLMWSGNCITLYALVLFHNFCECFSINILIEIETKKNGDKRDKKKDVFIVSIVLFVVQNIYLCIRIGKLDLC